MPFGDLNGIDPRMSANVGPFFPSRHGIENHQTGVLDPAIGIFKSVRKFRLQGPVTCRPGQFYLLRIGQNAFARQAVI